ncbi:MAG: hypothetical protein ABIB97_03025 [Patescibacteria group bacterium]
MSVPEKGEVVFCTVRAPVTTKLGQLTPEGNRLRLTGEVKPNGERPQNWLEVEVFDTQSDEPHGKTFVPERLLTEWQPPAEGNDS